MSEIVDAPGIRNTSEWRLLIFELHLWHSWSEWTVNFDCRLAEIKSADATNGIAWAEWCAQRFRVYRLAYLALEIRRNSDWKIYVFYWTSFLKCYSMLLQC